MFKKIASILLLITASFSVSSCNLFGGEPIDCRLVGNLDHIQYWNDNDAWDISSLRFEIVYSNGKTTKKKITSNNSVVVFCPSSPVGLEPTDNFSFTITKCIYKESGQKFELNSRTFNGIKIIEYPYKTTTTTSSDNSTFVFILCLLFFGFVISLYLVLATKSKNKKEMSV